MSRGSVVIRGATRGAFELTDPGTAGQVLMSNGAGADPTFQDAVVPTTTVLTNDQIKALPSTAIQILAAPGSGRVSMPLFALLLTSFAGGAYTNVNTTSSWITVRYGSVGFWGSFIANDTTASLTRLTDFLGTTARRAVIREWQHTVDPALDWGALTEPNTMNVNTALNLYADNGGSGNFTGGHAANTLTVHVWAYTVAQP